jgi:ribosomal protein S17E
MSETEALLEEAKSSLARVQNFNAEDLVQSGRLGESNFVEAVEPAKRIISLFKQLPSATLEYVPEVELNVVKSQANSLYQMFQEILAFDMNEGDVRNRQTQSVDKLKNAYQGYFTKLYPLISFSMARTVNFGQLEEQGRAAVQEIRDQTERLMAEIGEQKEAADRILEEVRTTAAERGVSQEATYFKDEADRHKTEAANWRYWTVVMAVVVGIYGISTLFFHKIAWLSPANTYETVQFIVGKVLVFFVLAYMLALCAKNFLSNRHNEIVNRHRQNALMTYKSLVDAGGTPEARDVILNHAASSVYRLHDTGYTKASDSSGSSSSSIIEMLPRTSLPFNSGGS